MYRCRILWISRRGRGNILSVVLCYISLTICGASPNDEYAKKISWEPFPHNSIAFDGLELFASALLSAVDWRSVASQEYSAGPWNILIHLTKVINSSNIQKEAPVINDRGFF